MSSYDDRLASLRQQAEDAEEAMRGVPEDQWPANNRDRLFAVFAYTRSILEATDAALVTDNATSGISAALSQFLSNPTAGAQNADPWGSTVIDALSHLPAARGRAAEQAAKDAAASFQRSAQRRLATLTSEFDSAKSEIAGMQANIEQRRTELATSIEEQQSENDAAMAVRLAEFEQNLATLTGQVEAEAAAVAKLRTTQTNEFEEAQGRRATAAKEQLDAAAAGFETFQERAKHEVGERIGEIRRMEKESAQLVGAIGLAGTAERYAEEVKEQKSAADVWRRATVVLAVLAVFGALFAISDDDPATEVFVGKLALSLIFAGVATYAARQSATHRGREQRARDLQLELTAFSPFIEPLSPEQQEEERVIMTRKTFGKATTTVAHAEEPGPTPLSFLLRRKEREADES
jgi:hypothetical protein